MTNAIDFVNLNVDNNKSINLEVSAQGQVIKGTLNFDQLLALNNTIELILNPDRDFELRLKNLKEFKRQVFTGYKQTKDPDIKAQKLELYIATKTLVSELENQRIRT